MRSAMRVACVVVVSCLAGWAFSDMHDGNAAREVAAEIQDAKEYLEWYKESECQDEVIIPLVEDYPTLNRVDYDPKALEQIFVEIQASLPAGVGEEGDALEDPPPEDQEEGPVITGKTAFLPGEVIEFSLDYTPPPGESFKMVWQSDVPHRSKPGSKRGVYQWAPEGDREHYIEGLVIVGTTFEDAREIPTNRIVWTLKRPPPPEDPKQLSELVSADVAKRLVERVYLPLKSVRDYDSMTDFMSTHDELLKITNLNGHGAQEEIDRRLRASQTIPEGFALTPLFAEIDVIISELGSSPVTPTPTDPDPTTPTIPTTPGTPVSFQGFRVVMYYESEPEDTSHDWALGLIWAPKIKTYLDSHCDGGISGWRAWDDDLSPENAPVWLQEMHRTPRPVGTPSVVIASKGQARTFPMPQTEDALIALLSQYGGP